MVSCLSLGDDNGKVMRNQGWQEDSKGVEIFIFFLSDKFYIWQPRRYINNTKQCQDVKGCCVALAKHQRTLRFFVLGDEGMLGRCLKMTRMMVSARGY
jgi:hypothetical protein